MEKNQYFRVSKEQLDRAKKQRVEMDQPHCAFRPHCVVLFPRYHDPDAPKKLLPTGQTFVVKNSASVPHNVKWDCMFPNAPGNQTMASGGEVTLPLVPAKSPIALQCNIHPWMTAWARAFDHPYATLTRKDGTYEIKGVPTGVKVRVVAWHETGWVSKDLGKGDVVELKEGTTTHNFRMKAR